MRCGEGAERARWEQPQREGHQAREPAEGGKPDSAAEGDQSGRREERGERKEGREWRKRNPRKGRKGERPKPAAEAGRTWEATVSKHEEAPVKEAGRCQG